MPSPNQLMKSYENLLLQNLNLLNDKMLPSVVLEQIHLLLIVRTEAVYLSNLHLVQTRNESKLKGEAE